MGNQRETVCLLGSINFSIIIHSWSRQSGKVRLHLPVTAWKACLSVCLLRFTEANSVPICHLYTPQISFRDASYRLFFFFFLFIWTNQATLSSLSQGPQLQQQQQSIDAQPLPIEIGCISSSSSLFHCLLRAVLQLSNDLLSFPVLFLTPLSITVCSTVRHLAAFAAATMVVVVVAVQKVISHCFCEYTAVIILIDWAGRLIRCCHFWLKVLCLQWMWKPLSFTFYAFSCLVCLSAG